MNALVCAASELKQLVFAFGGFEQANYVLGEIRRPHRKYPIGMIAAVSLVCILYMAVNVCYMVVVPREMQIEGTSVALSFFKLTFGTLTDHETAGRVFSAFLAISSMGNILGMVSLFQLKM